jgi:hypothetical protein
MRACVGAVVHF